MSIVLIAKVLFINIFTYSVCLKIINVKNNSNINIKIIIASIITTIIYITLRSFSDSVYFIVIEYFVQLLFLKIVIANNEQPLMIANLIANSLVYVGFVFATFIETIIRYTLKVESDLLNLIIILIIEGVLLYNLFKIKRLKNGFNFLKNKMNIEYLDIVMINISSIIIFTYCLFGNSYEYTTEHLSITLIIFTIIMLIVIQKTFNLYYKQKLLAKTIEDYKSQIFDKDKQIEKLSKEKYKISKLNHEFYNRQKALELKVQEFVNNTKLEIGQDLSVTKQIENLSKEYSNKLTEIKGPDKLPSTDIEEIDDMFKYMQSECSKNGIIFNLQVTDNIHYMINNIIEQDKLVTLIGDHIRDAIIAVSNSENKFKSIIAILGKKDNCYEFCVYDTGIEFEIDTLLKLGIEPATTHKDTGGTGIGFMTTFETMKETKASLIISENKPADDDYTKSVAIRFDNKNEYRICSYRANQIREKDINNRIIIENKNIAK